MSTITPIHEYTTVDKSTWAPGIWQNEPDKVQWIDEATGLDCLIHRGPNGALCGYVGVTPGHPAYEKDYDAVHDLFPNYDEDGALAVHGGLTYADRCQESDDESTGVCHVPQDDRPADVWWLGFDCAHLHDLTPAYKSSGIIAGSLETYKNFGYVQGEVAELARQLAGLV